MKDKIYICCLQLYFKSWNPPNLISDGELTAVPQARYLDSRGPTSKGRERKMWKKEKEEEKKEREVKRKIGVKGKGKKEKGEERGGIQVGEKLPPGAEEG